MAIAFYSHVSKPSKSKEAINRWLYLELSNQMDFNSI